VSGFSGCGPDDRGDKRVSGDSLSPDDVRVEAANGAPEQAADRWQHLSVKRDLTAIEEPAELPAALLPSLVKFEGLVEESGPQYVAIVMPCDFA
jgi:hypothetical protein